ncbi:PepSY domain-containing protein (plasmid) [Rhizobium sp. CB3090]|uniref:PepSY domain-containing protein n=1 Tax=Rhizobium sp. CB3090 TaxID=3039156 RepID=UPI0024B28439|nr:PepSY domain-containing protein [Rhizobium sp. CB3090]WFU13237.1 PepSY domain-containing protein [Rhizobium sp. CB3090]
MNFKMLISVAVAAAAPALAHASPSCTKEPKSAWMSQDAMKSKIDQQGYKVRTFQVTGNCYEIYGKDKDGKRAEVYFNPVTGAIVKAEIGD